MPPTTDTTDSNARTDGSTPPARRTDASLPTRAAADRPVTAFVALAFGLSWAAWFAAFALLPPPFRTVGVLAGPFGPPVAAAVVTRLRGESVRGWLRRILSFDVSPGDAALALLAPLLAAGVALGVLLATGGDVAPTRLLAVAPVYAVNLVVVSVVGGGQEELGWRGFALPHLQRRFDAATASLLLGAAWALWHLPLFVHPAGLYYGTSFVLYVPVVVALSVVLGGLQNRVGRSVLPAVLLHAGVNASTPLLGPVEGASVPLVGALAVGVALVAAVPLVRYGPETLAPGDAVTPSGPET